MTFAIVFSVVLLALAWLVRIIRWAPKPYPPPPSGDFIAMLEWEAGNPNLHPAIRLSASTALCRLHERRCEDARIRQILREEILEAARHARPRC